MICRKDQFYLLLIPLFILLLGNCLYAEDAEKAETSQSLKLKETVIKDTDHILSETDINFKQEFEKIRIRDGAIVPMGHYISFPEQGGDGKLSFGENSVTVGINGGIPFYEFEGKKKKLKKTSQGISTIILKLPDKRKYSIAIPYVANVRGDKKGIWMRPGYTMKGSIGAEKLLLYDNNMDTVFDTKNDMYTLGKGMIFAPLTEKIALGKTIIKINTIEKEGTGLSYTEETPEKTGTFSIKFNNKKLDAHMALVSDDGSLSFVDQGREKRTVVPVGKYQLKYGFVYSPKEKCVAALMVPTKKMQPFDIDEGRNKKIKIGTDISLIFDPVRRPDGKIDISGSRVSLEGKDGERYFGFEVIGKPLVAVRVSKGKKKIIKPMDPPSFCLT